ncbi:hypothetical protein BV20DRAFT_963990 [Pilatotrama ljubarskyi]|nr:hypothetical protein BV20DRAFT_963990 [Pilatotrama ljubarskyi]
MTLPLSHPLWSIAEVVREVMKQSADDRGALAQCARVSRAFSEPALEVLWQELSGLDQLLGLLPTSFRKVLRGQSDGDASDDDIDNNFGLNDTTLVLVDAIRDKEWARLIHYARWVRVYTTMKSDKIDGLATAILLEKLQGRPLLPRLTRLLWHRPFDLSTMLPLFLSPMLRSVSLDLLEGGVRRIFHEVGHEPTAPEYAYGTALQLIRARAPRLRDVELFTSAFPCSINQLRNFDGIDSLSLHLIQNEALVLELCSTLPHLRKLIIRLARRFRPASPPPHIPEFTLPSLTLLDLNGHPLATVNLISAINAPKLHAVYLAFEAREEPWKRCIELVISRFGSSLRKFTADIEDIYDDSQQVPFSFHEWFSPLYALRKLIEFKVDSHFETEFDVTAEDVENMVTAWPKLRALGVPPVHPQSSALPITALQTIAAKCPRLELLTLPAPHYEPLVKAKAICVRPQSSMKDILFLGLRWPTEVHKRCMAYVKKLFPRATTIRFEEDYDSEDEG